jgi:phosphatidate cytidylyltransferase
LNLLKRAIASLIMAAIGIPAIIYGGIFYFLLISFFLVLAAWEYVRIFQGAKNAPSMVITVGGVLLVLIFRFFLPNHADPVLVLLILAAMTWHLFDFERGRDNAATDFAITLTGILYLGWVGAYLLDLRFIPEGGLWWLLVTLGSVWIADMAAYFIGSRFGRHKLSPRLSPKKSWEGYWAGVVIGSLGAIALALLFHDLGSSMTWWQGGFLGLVMSIFTTLGDLGESMLKRQAGVKDSSNIIPGHGGFLDRIDSWLWAGVIGFYLVNWFFIK